MDKRKSLGIVACIFMALGIGVCFVVSIVEHDKDEKLDLSKNVEDIEYVGSLEYSVGCDSSGTYLNNVIVLSEEEIRDIYREYKRYDFDEISKELEEDILYHESYIFTIDDIEIELESNSTSGVINGKYYELGKFSDYLIDFAEAKIADNDVYLFIYDDVSIESHLYSEKITDEDKVLLESLKESINYNVPEMNLAIALKYVLIIDNTYIYIGGLDGFAMIDNKIVVLPDEMIGILENYLTFESEECCSCCPDLKPGETCIALCCPCSE